MSAIAVMQPTFLPWLGYFDLIDQSDVFVLYNNVQFSKQSWQVRNRINTHSGIQWLNIPVIKCPLSTPIEEVKIDNTKPWKKKILMSLKVNYGKSGHFLAIYEWLEGLIGSQYLRLEEFNNRFIEETSTILGIKTKFIKSSELSLQSTDRVGKLLEIAKLTRASRYISTIGAYDYLLAEQAGAKFKNEKISLVFHQYHPVVYKVHHQQFEPYMSILDCLFNNGFGHTLEIIRNGRQNCKTFCEMDL